MKAWALTAERKTLVGAPPLNASCNWGKNLNGALQLGEQMLAPVGQIAAQHTRVGSTVRPNLRKIVQGLARVERLQQQVHPPMARRRGFTIRWRQIPIRARGRGVRSFVRITERLVGRTQTKCDPRGNRLVPVDTPDPRPQVIVKIQESVSRHGQFPDFGHQRRQPADLQRGITGRPFVNLVEKLVLGQQTADHRIRAGMQEILDHLDRIGNPRARRRDRPADRWHGSRHLLQPAQFIRVGHNHPPVRTRRAPTIGSPSTVRLEIRHELPPGQQRQHITPQAGPKPQRIRSRGIRARDR
jgi:hypothetical protein